jgi:soluble lytic murein transglycosylase-like protein
MDLLFARSRRRAASRRKVPPRRSPVAQRSVRAAALAVVLLTVVAVSTRLESSNAKPPAARAAVRTPALDPSCPVPERFGAAFAAAAARTGVPVSLLVATAYEESRMNPRARSDAGARGLLQLMPATARSLRLAGDDPAANVLAGALYLRQLIDRFGSVDLALAAYNAGPTAVEHAGAAPTLGTLRYVKNVQDRAGLLDGCR